VVPATAVDAAGAEVTEPEQVKEQWRRAWARLATHDADDARFDRAFHDYIETRPPGDPTAVSAGELEFDGNHRPEVYKEQAKVLNEAIQLAEVRDSVRRLQRGKAVGCDNISAELLKEGGPEMIRCLHSLCCIAWSTGQMPQDWLRGAVVPLHKDGDRRNPLNYRPITLLSIVGKVFTGVLEARLSHWAEHNGILVPEQAGFRPGRGCPEQVFALMELINTRRRAGQTTYACFIDIQKAYDTVWHEGLKAKLRRYGIHGSMYAALCGLYAGCESAIQLGERLGLTDSFPIETGVRQGCVLSPMLYSLFLNDLAQRLKKMGDERGIGVPVGNSGRLTLLLYADDIVLLSDSKEGLQLLMQEVHEYSRQWRFSVNHAKCGLMCFKPSGSPPPMRPLPLGPSVVQWVTQYKYLGVELECEEPLRFRAYRRRALATALRAANAVSGLGLYSGKLGVPLGVQVYKAMVRPLLEYCAEVWSGYGPLVGAEQVQTLMAKRILQVSKRTSNEAVRGELGLQLLDARWQKARLLFWGKLCSMPLDNPARRVLLASEAAFAFTEDADAVARATRGGTDPSAAFAVVYGSSRQSGGRSLPWCAQLQFDLAALGEPLRAFWRSPDRLRDDFRALQEFRRLATVSVRDRERNRWWNALGQHSSLCTYRELKAGPTALQLQRNISCSTVHFFPTNGRS